ncbi:MAG: transporter [Bacteroidales bacterium]|jgi:BASS family bile acid:Na+ symporter|nr:transporter [Bacteroidales bacterium]
MQKYRSLVLPIAILLGFLFDDTFSKMSPIVPYLIAAMLFLTCCNVDIKHIKLSSFYAYLLGFQVVISLLVYFLLNQWDKPLAEGALVLILAPTATSAVVVATMLGAKLNTMLTYTLLCNLMTALVAPIYFAFISPQDIDFAATGLSILRIFREIFPMLFVPLFLALLVKKLLPKVNQFLLKCGIVSFYLWAIALTVVVGRTIKFIKEHTSDSRQIVIMAITAGILCIIQFMVGRYFGKKYGDTVAGGQSLGQKNTVLAIWMAQTYLPGLACVLPAMYVICQNLFNSYQLARQKSEKKEKKNVQCKQKSVF